MVDLRSTYNFIDSTITSKLRCEFTTIKSLTVEATNRSTMLCTIVCKNFKWKMQGNNFKAYVFIF
jgi:hypothetical protein